MQWGLSQLWDGHAMERDTGEVRREGQELRGEMESQESSVSESSEP
jgi:hypothetical protein